VVRSNRTYRFAVGPDELWTAIARTDDYRSWWPWLRGFEATGLVQGDVWRCVVQPPLPYTLRFTITLDAVQPGVGAMATIAGEISGTAELTVAADGDGSSIRLVSDLAPASPLLRAAAIAARPLVIWGHDWVLDRGASQFKRQGLRAEGPA
jgi:hypothetical protein